MSRIFTALTLTALLAGCDGTNPFIVATDDTGDTESLDPNDPNTDVNNKFAFDTNQRLTMNSVSFDDNDTPTDNTDDVLVINNLPFDGPDGEYVQIQEFANGGRVFASQQTATTGLTQTYAVFLRSDHLEATSAASGQWIDFGYAGANINRDSFALPGTDGEYVYQGSYVSTRTFDDRGGIEIVTGDIQLRLDELDFDPDGDLEGAIDGVIFDREREGAAGALGLGELPDIILAVTRFDGETGIWEAGTASTFTTEGDLRDSGTHDGMIAGSNGEEMGGYVIVQGVADIQTVQYQVVRYRTTTPTGLFDPVTGDEIFLVETGVSSGLDDVEIEALQDQINAGLNVVDFLPATGVPSGAEIISDDQLTFDLQTEYDAREIGVFIADIVPG